MRPNGRTAGHSRPGSRSEDGTRGRAEDSYGPEPFSGPGPVVKVRPQTLGNGEHELAHRDVGKDVIHQVSRGLGHALGMGRRLLPVRPI